MDDGPLGMIVLAAGRSRRFGDDDKRTARLSDGRFVLEATLDNLVPAVEETLVVLRADDDELSALLKARDDVSLVICTDSDLGVGHSLAAGATEALNQCWRAAFVMLADMPFVQSATLKAMINAHDDAPLDSVILQPEYDSHPGHPVLFDQRYFEALTALTGDEGARSVVAQNRSQLRRLRVSDAGILADIDQPSDLR